MEEVSYHILFCLQSIFIDDVGALVFDAGSHSFRAGFGGEEYPKVSFL
jgi:actin-related protein